MSKNHSIILRIISTIILVAFIWTQAAWGCEVRVVSSQTENSHLRSEQAKATGVEGDLTKDLGAKPTTIGVAPALSVGTAAANGKTISKGSFDYRSVAPQIWDKRFNAKDTEALMAMTDIKDSVGLAGYNSTIRTFPDNAKTILEVGFGSGRNLIKWAQDNPAGIAWGVDLSDNALRVATEGSKMRNTQNARFFKADMFHLPFRDDKFDAVFSQGVLEHYFPEQIKQLIQEQYRVLKPGGRLVVEVPNYYCPSLIYALWVNGIDWRNVWPKRENWSYNYEQPQKASDITAMLEEIGLTDIEVDGFLPWYGLKAYRWKTQEYPWYRNLVLFAGMILAEISNLVDRFSNNAFSKRFGYEITVSGTKVVETETVNVLAAENKTSGNAIGNILTAEEQKLVDQLWSVVDREDSTRFNEIAEELQVEFQKEHEDDFQVISPLGTVEDLKGFLHNSLIDYFNGRNAIYPVISLALENVEQHGDDFGALILRFHKLANDKIRISAIILDQGNGFVDKQNRHVPIERTVEYRYSFGKGGKGGVGLTMLLEASDYLSISTADETFGKRFFYYWEKGDSREESVRYSPVDHGTKLVFVKDLTIANDMRSMDEASATGELTFEQQVEKAKQFLKDNNIGASYLRVDLDNKAFTLDLSHNAHLSDISGLAGFTRLERLYLSSTQVSDISVLKDLINLKKLYLSNVQLSDISALAKLINLEELYLSGTSVSDISVLRDLVNLKILDLSHNVHLSDISALAGLTRLERLYLSGNRLSDISVLSGLLNLKVLNLSKTQISDISDLSSLANLEGLDLYGTQVSNISYLSGLLNLKVLNLSKTQISDISALKGLVNLKILYLSDTLISDISALRGITKLEKLYLSNTPLSSDDIFNVFSEDFSGELEITLPNRTVTRCSILAVKTILFITDNQQFYDFAMKLHIQSRNVQMISVKLSGDGSLSDIDIVNEARRTYNPQEVYTYLSSPASRNILLSFADLQPADLSSKDPIEVAVFLTSM